jgi:CRISPR-associated exonuclease Cas4
MRPSSLYLLIPLAFILTSLLILVLSARFKRRIGLPPGQIVYADAENWGKPRKPLYDSALGLTGKPDYLIRKKDATIPVEVKSTWAPSSPIRYSQELEEKLVNIIHTIRLEKNSRDVGRSHNQPRRCTRCGYRNICSQRI